MAGLDFSDLMGPGSTLDFTDLLGKGSARRAQAREMAGWEKTLDLLSRTTYVSAGFADRMLDEDTRNIAEAWNFARGEFFDPEERLTYSDVLRRHAPEWSQEHPVLNFVAGLGMDIALDPLTYVGPGAIKGVGNLTGGVVRGTSKAAKHMGQLMRGTLYDDLTETAARGMAIAIADDAASAGGDLTVMARAGVELNETKRAYSELLGARKATEKSVGRQYEKRLKNLQDRQAKDIIQLQKEAAQRTKRAELEALKDIEQYGVADARRVRELRQQFPTLPERSVEQAGQLGRDSRLVPERAARTSGRTKKVAELRKAKEGREAFEVVPEKVINPQYGKGQGPGFMTEEGSITRVGEAIAPDKGAQLGLRATETEPATRVTKLGKPVRDPLRGRKGVPHSDEIVRYVDEITSPVEKEWIERQAKMNLEHRGQLRVLQDWKIRALNDGMDIEREAVKIGRKRAQSARFKMRWMDPAEKRVADTLTNPKIRDVFEEGSKYGWNKALNDFWTNLDKNLGVTSGMKAFKSWAATSDSWFGRKFDMMGELFSRNYKLPEWLIKHRELLYGRMLRAVPKVQDELKRVFGTMDKESSERLGQKFYEIFWETEKAKKTQGGLKVGQADEIRMKHLEDLTEQERIVASRVHQRFQEIGELDFHAGLVDELYDNYVPGLYTNLEKNFIGMSKKLKKKVPNEFTPGEHKLFTSLDQITHAGMKPVRDLQTLYVARVLAHEQGAARAMFNSTLEVMYPGLKLVREAGPEDLLHYKTSVNVKNIKKQYPGATRIESGVNKGAWQSKDGFLITPSDRVINEITYVGHGLYGPEGFAGASRVAHGYDKMLNVFRASATVLKPAFAFKQLISNTAQVYLEMGHKGLRMWDPRVMMDTAMIMSRNEPHFMLRGAFGEQMSGKQLLAEVRKHGIMTNTPMDVGLAKDWNPRNVREMQRLVNRERNIRKISKESEVAEGFTRSFMGALKYTDLPGHVEDWSRVATYINARRMGFSAEQAAKHTKDALFDYMHGLSEFEAKWMRRIIPFYSYQRFAIPLMAKTLVHAPGRIANTGKVTDAFFKSFNKFTGGETLTESERRVVPGWLLDQPHAFIDFDDRMRATFGTFNSFTPLDIITNFQGLAGLDDISKFDVDETMGRALEKGVLSQITPIIKWPLEAMINRKFFQGSQVARIAKTPGMDKVAQGDLDPDIFFENMVGATAAVLSRKHNTTAWAMIGKFMGRAAANMDNGDDVIRGFLELATGWEEGRDPQTGERTVYMSPWKIHAVTSFMPFMKDVFRQSDPELTPMEKTLSLYTGRQTVKLDLGEELARKRKTARTVMRRKRADLRNLYTMRRLEEYDGALADLRNYYNEIGDHMNELHRHGVRRAKPAVRRARTAYPFSAKDEEENALDFSDLLK